MLKKHIRQTIYEFPEKGKLPRFTQETEQEHMRKQKTCERIYIQEKIQVYLDINKIIPLQKTGNSQNI